MQFTGATQLAVSLYHACAVKSDHTLWCWGDNSEGQIGVGSSAATIANPTQVTALFSMVGSVATTDTYYYDTCAGTMDGSAYCWGGNGYGGFRQRSDERNGSGSLAGVDGRRDAAHRRRQRDRLELGLQDVRAQEQRRRVVWGTTADLYAVPLTDNTSAQVTGVTVTGRSCYLDNGDLLWVNGAKSSYQITCN